MIAPAQSNPGSGVFGGPAAQIADRFSQASNRPIATRTQVEFVKLAYGQLVNGTLASTAGAIAFSLAVSTEHPGNTLWSWLAAMVGIAGYRLWLAGAFARANPTSVESLGWAAHYTFATTLTGVGWGASTWIFPTPMSPGTPLAVLHVLILAGLATGASRLLAPLRRASIAYLAVMLVPLAAKFFMEGNLVGVTAGGCVLLFIAYMISTVLQNHEMLAASLAIRFERDALAQKLQTDSEVWESREAELHEARARAESANRAKGEFLATISHEIRTPMNGVLGMLRVMRDTPLADDQRHYLKVAADSAESLLVLLNDVLDFSKIEAGRLEIEPAPFPPATIAQAAADLMLARARDKGLQFDLHLSDNLPGAVIGDANRVRQILVNLLGNAVKFTERGRVELIVACAERNESRAVMHFTVKDTGIGIDSSALERLFKPFTQAEASMTRRFGGTGLGLAISTRLAQAMGGVLQVQSTLNRGSIFRLILPCKLPELEETPTAMDTPRFVAPRLSGRVLVVEDDAVNQQVMDLFLRKLNVMPRFAADGEEAVALATSEPFDLVLMDCQLPGIDGLEATRRIRRQLVGKPLKIVALTANAGLTIREACLAAGMNEFLTKPVRLEHLAGMLQRHLPECEE